MPRINSCSSLQDSLRASANRDRSCMTNGHERFHHPGRSLRVPTKEGTRAPLPLGGLTIPTTMSPNYGAQLVVRFHPTLAAVRRSSLKDITGGQDSLR